MNYHTPLQWADHHILHIQSLKINRRRIYLHLQLVDHVIYFNPLTTGAAYIRVFIFYWHINYHLLNMLKIKCDINQHDLKTVDLHIVKSEWVKIQIEKFGRVKG